MILFDVLSSLWTLSYILKARRFRVFENWEQRNLYLRGKRYQDAAEKIIVKSFMIYTPHKILRWSGLGEWGGSDIWHV